MDILGVDVGGVIIDCINDGTNTSFFLDNYLNTTAVSGVFEALAQLTRDRFRGEVHIVSTCGARVAENTRHWMLHHNFYERTGIQRDNVHFCRERHDKAGICTGIGISHFIDDRLEVLSHLTDVDTRILFQGRAEENARFAEHLPLVKRVANWDEVLAFLL